MASMVTAHLPSRSRPPPDPPPSTRRKRNLPGRLKGSPPLLHLRLALHPLKHLLRKFFPRVFLSPVTPPEPPDPLDASSVVALFHFLITSSSLSPLAITPDLDFLSSTLESRGCDVPLLFSGVSLFFYGCLFSRPSPQAFTQTSTLKPPSRIATKNGSDGGLPVSASDTLFAYGLHSPVIYRPLFECVDWLSISFCFDLPTTSLCKVFHAYLSSLFFTYSATVEWFRQLFVWMMLELKFIMLAGDIPMGVGSFGYIFVTSSSIYIALARSSAVCSSLTDSIPGVGVMFVYLSSWWQVEEKLIVIFSLMNMEVAGYDFPLVPHLNKSSFLIFPPTWSELDEQVSLVLQGSSSHRILFSAYGAVCVVPWVTLDAIFEEAYDVVVIRLHMVSFYDLYRHSISYVVVVCLAVNSLLVSFSFAGE